MGSSKQESSPDRDSYEFLWKKVIAVEIERYKSKYGDLIAIVPAAKEEIWHTYNELNFFCKCNYMHATDEKIDRHKVCACYLIAVATVKPLRFTSEKYFAHAVNEQLAITVAFSLLRAFTISCIRKDESLPLEERDLLCQCFENGIALPNTSHGNYIENFANEIHFSVRDGTISILSIAHELFLLELYTKQSCNRH